MNIIVSLCLVALVASVVVQCAPMGSGDRHSLPQAIQPMANGDTPVADSEDVEALKRSIEVRLSINPMAAIAGARQASFALALAEAMQPEPMEETLLDPPVPKVVSNEDDDDWGESDASAEDNSWASDPCPICYEPMSEVSLKMKCNHIFHYKCMEAYMEKAGDQSIKCPMCRSKSVYQLFGWAST